MSMHTIFVLMNKNGETVSVSPSLSADEAVRFFSHLGAGQVVACVVSDAVAGEIRTAMMKMSLSSKEMKEITRTLRMFSHSMTPCADVT